MNVKPKDIIAIIAMIILVAIKILQGDTNIDAIVTLILGYYFAKRSDPPNTSTPIIAT